MADAPRTELEDTEIVTVPLPGALRGASGEPLRRFAEGVWIEPSPRWVRTYLGGVAIADSRRVLLVFEPRRLPVYWFPASDVRMDLLRPGAEVRSGRSRITRYDIQVGDRLAERAAWSLRAPGPERARLDDHLAFVWDRMDAWFEEDDEVFVHARDPYSRVDVLNSSRSVRVQAGGRVLAESTRPRLLVETGLPTRYYLPKRDVDMKLLVPSSSTSRCPYKGVAVYWSVPDGDAVLEDLAWSYPAPIPECPKIENLLSFYNERVDIFVDGVEQPRPVTGWS